MNLYSCKCGLLANEGFKVCPRCGNEKEKDIVSVYDLNKEVFTITMEDVISVIVETGLEEDISKFSEKEVMDILRRKMDIPWTEYVESTLKAYFVNR